MANQTELNRTPIYVPYNETRRRRRTANGITIDDITLKRYYSSINAEIYFNNEYVEDIVDIIWNVNQAHLPIYGYNSYTFDEVAIGSRIIQGSFSIAFTSPNYLFGILDAITTEAPITSQEYIFQPTERNTLEPNGSIAKQVEGSREGTKFQELWPKTFDIDIVYGNKKDAREGTVVNQDDEVHIILEDVRLLNVTSGASIKDPSVVTEVYQFVARDLKTIA